MTVGLTIDDCSATMVKKVFVVGNSRSGTTIMARLLGRSHDVYTFHEIHFFEQIWDPLADARVFDRSEAAELMSRLINLERDDYYGTKNIEKYADEASQIVELMEPTKMTAPDLYSQFLTYETQRFGRKIACEQTPRNVFYIADIMRLFPEALIINVVRDPRAILLSQKNKWRIRSHGAKNFPLAEVFRSWLNYHPITMSILWNAASNATESFASHPQVNFVLFEEFASEPDKTAKELCKFIGIRFVEEMLNIPHREGGTSSLLRTDEQQGRGIDKEAAFRWLKGGVGAGELYLCQVICAAQMKRYGYTPLPTPIFSTIFFALGYVLTWPFQIVFALMANVSRHKNLLGSIKRRIF